MDVHDILTEYVNANCTEVSDNEYIETEYIEED